MTGSGAGLADRDDESTPGGLRAGVHRTQDLTAQRNSLAALGVGDDRIYVDHGLTGTNRDRPGLRLALAACHSGDTLVVTKLDRLARSLPDARDILDELTQRNVWLSLGGSIHDPTDPVGRLLFNVLAMVAEFEADLISMRTREGMKVAKAKGRLRGKQPKLTKSRPGICWNSSTAGTTPRRSWPSCSASAGRPSIARSAEYGRCRSDRNDPSPTFRRRIPDDSRRLTLGRGKPSPAARKGTVKTTAGVGGPREREKRSARPG